jgi:type III restriction enzyme
VKLKRDVAVKWCGLATGYAAGTGGKRWRYALNPHDVIADNRTLEGLVNLYQQDIG